MAARFTRVSVDWAAIYAYFGAVDRGFRYPPQYNIAPSQDVVAIISDGRERRLGPLRWGLIPRSSTTSNPGINTFNARAESLHVAAPYRGLLSRKRCVIVADGFVDWQRNTKKPFRFRLVKQDVFGFAGLYDTWVAPNGRLKVHSCSIITTRANWFMLSYSERMPVILDQEAQDIWLDRSIQDERTLMSLLMPYHGDMYAYRVSDRITEVGFDGPECIMEVTDGSIRA